MLIHENKLTRYFQIIVIVASGKVVISKTNSPASNKLAIIVPNESNNIGVEQLQKATGCLAKIKKAR